MEGAATDLAAALSDQLLDSAQHLLGGTAGEGEQQDASRSHAALDQSRDAIYQRTRFARARACNYQQRTVTMSGGGELLRVQHFGVADAEFAFVSLRNGQLAFKDDYVLGHDGPSLA
jgi:hypothetical protein